MTDEERNKKLIAARARFGKPWITELRVDRVTPPSARLKELMERAPKVNKVTRLRRNGD